jgi:hypothetical protein
VRLGVKSGVLRAAAAALALCVATPAHGKAFNARLFGLSGDFYRVVDAGALLEMPGCDRPCPSCAAVIDFDARTARFAGATCRIAWQYRASAPPAGLHDGRVDRVAPGFYAVVGGGLLIEAPSCAVAARGVPMRLVATPGAQRMLLSAPDHPQASITGRVSCPIMRVWRAVAF